MGPVGQDDAPLARSDEEVTDDGTNPASPEGSEHREADEEDFFVRRRPPAPSWVARLGSWRHVVTANPFYLISACLVLYGLNVALHDPGNDIDRWVLFGILEGYTLLLGIAAVLLVRFGQVWDDARTVMLLVVVLLMAGSVGLDQMVADAPLAGGGLVLIALGFGLALSEAMLHAARIRLPVLFRAPYHGLLALFYLYPVGLGGLLTEAVETLQFDRLAWGHALFPVAAGLGFLTLLPAIRRGERFAVGDSGTPWPWPQLPFSPFVLLAVGFALRAWVNGIGYWSANVDTNPFSLYLLAPMVLALAVLLFEIGITERRARLVQVALGAPAVAVIMSFPFVRDLAQETLLRELLDVGAAPPVAITALAGVFYAVALLRGWAPAEPFLIASILLFSVIDPDTAGLRTTALPSAVPFALLGVFLLGAAFARRESVGLRGLAGSGALLIAACLAFRGTWFTDVHGAVPIHLGLLTVLVVAARVDDPIGRQLRRVAGLPVGVLFAIVLFFGDRLVPGAPTGAVPAYLVALWCVAPAGWFLFGHRLWLWTAAATAGLGLLHGSSDIYRWLHDPERGRGVIYVCWGLAFFALAASVSFVKSGHHRGIVTRLRRLLDRHVAPLDDTA